MKTTNNVQKTNLKSMVFAAGLIVIGFSVDGQGATKSDLMNDNNNQLAFASVKMESAKITSTGKGATASLAAYLAPASEEALTVEKWMTDERNFSGTGKNQTSERTASFEIITSKFVYREVNTEEELKVEPWMIDLKVWK